MTTKERSMSSFYHFDRLSKEPNLIHAITKRVIGRPYDMSLALHTGEDTQEIISNRRSIAKSIFGLESIDRYNFIVANQTHSNHIQIIDSDISLGWEDQESAITDCDALVTNHKNIILTIMTADCVPILLYDPIKEVVAAIHAGWRGTESQIVVKSIESMVDRFGTSPSDIIAGIAPAIGGCCYEVGIDVAQYFMHYPTVTEEVKRGKYMLDLPMVNRVELLSVGVLEENIQMSSICTACSVDEFFSYRREHGCSGRFMSMIGMKH
jgi:YfiH family protein